MLGRRHIGYVVTEREEKSLAEIEATQLALRDSIEATKGLAEQAETLLKKHKRMLKRDAEKS